MLVAGPLFGVPCKPIVGQESTRVGIVAIPVVVLSNLRPHRPENRELLLHPLKSLDMFAKALVRNSDVIVEVRLSGILLQLLLDSMDAHFVVQRGVALEPS